MNLQVNFARLKADIEALSMIGRADSHGIYRMAFSDGDMAARSWLKARIRDAGLAFEQDGAANLHAVLNSESDQPAVATGSHIDSVPNAGHLDGALGVLCGLEALRTLSESDVALKRPVELIAFSDEEGRFGGMFGSQAISGEITPEWLLESADLEGVRLIDAMAERGLDAMDALCAARRPESLHAFVELHIEQGPVLDGLDTPIGVVEGICGLRRWEVRLTGTSNHAGTTPMHLRNDAFQALTEFASQLNRILEENGDVASVATIGRVELLPGAANVIPGEVRFSLEFRDTGMRVLDALADSFETALYAITKRRDIGFEFEVMSDIAPVACDAHVRSLITATADELDYPAHALPSGAAHDTQKMARIAPAGMIFVPSKAGRSHSAAEWTDWKDIEAGANVLLNTLARLALED